MRVAPNMTSPVAAKVAVNTVGVVTDARTSQDRMGFGNKVYQWLRFRSGDLEGWIRDDMIEIWGDGGAQGYPELEQPVLAQHLWRDTTETLSNPIAQDVSPLSKIPKPDKVQVFLSYRRADGATAASALHDHLAGYLGGERVFKDKYDIPLGADFPTYIGEAIRACVCVLVVIGRDWARLLQERLEDEVDYVRVEVETALQQRRIVIPVLVEGAVMPSTKELPESLRPLPRLNAVFLRPDPDFHADCEGLIRGIEAYLK
jgi:hypothetical protein